ncbi:MAG: class I tRNA ligase family protein, partial [Deltaproteobacteria bacterium]
FYQHQSLLAEVQAPEKEISFSEKCLALRRKTHWMIQKMTEDIESEKFNVAISAAMELVNELYGALTENDQFFSSQDGKWTLQEAMQSLLLCLAPFAPHMMEELWHEMGHRTLIAGATWPSFRPDLLTESKFTLVVQVNGKVRERVEVAKGISKDEVQKLVLEMAKIKPFIDGKTLKQFVYVPERIANVVVV